MLRVKDSNPAGGPKMQTLKYAAIGLVVALAGAMAGTANAQVRVGIGIGIGTPVYVGPPPVCPYGYYPYRPYACAPYGYYGPEWFVNGVFIGAGPWFRGFYGPAFYGRRDFDFDDPAWVYFHDHDGWRYYRDGDRWRDFRGDNWRDFHGRDGWRGHDGRNDFRGPEAFGRNHRRVFRAGRDFHSSAGFRGNRRNGGRDFRFRGARGHFGGDNRGFHGNRGFRANGAARGRGEFHGGNHGHGNHGRGNHGHGGRR